MCLLCVEIAKGSMNIREVARAYIELVDDSHTDEILTTIEDNYGKYPFLDALLDLEGEFGELD